MIALIAWAVAAVPLDLPAGESAEAWGDALALGGFVEGPASTGARVSVEDRGAVWRLRVVTVTGTPYRVDVPRPRTAREREDLVWLAASLLRPGAKAGVGWDDLGAPAAPVGRPPPPVAVRRAPPPVEPAPAPTLAATEAPPTDPAPTLAATGSPPTDPAPTLAATGSPPTDPAPSTPAPPDSPAPSDPAPPPDTPAAGDPTPPVAAAIALATAESPPATAPAASAPRPPRPPPASRQRSDEAPETVVRARRPPRTRTPTVEPAPPKVTEPHPARGWLRATAGAAARDDVETAFAGGISGGVRLFEALDLGASLEGRPGARLLDLTGDRSMGAWEGLAGAWWRPRGPAAPVVGAAWGASLRSTYEDGQPRDVATVPVLVGELGVAAQPSPALAAEPTLRVSWDLRSGELQAGNQDPTALTRWELRAGIALRWTFGGEPASGILDNSP